MNKLIFRTEGGVVHPMTLEELGFTEEELLLRRENMGSVDDLVARVRDAHDKVRRCWGFAIEYYTEEASTNWEEAEQDFEDALLALVEAMKEKK